MKTCGTKGCSNPHKARGLCNRCYQWARRRDFDVEPNPQKGVGPQKLLFKFGKRRCATCGTTKTLDKFHDNRSNPKGKSYECRTCANTRNRDRLQETRRKRAEVLRRYKKMKGCQDCGEDDIRVLTFHHPEDVEKEMNLNIANMSNAWNKIKAEVKKCEVLCANCHRKHENYHLVL